MVKLIYSPIASLDGYVEDEQGKFDWAAPDDEVHAFVNELERPIGTYLYGRRLYETMVFWETVSVGANQPAVIRDFAEIWRAAEKIVFSRTLQTVASARTHIERTFDPDAVRRHKEAAGADITLGGAELARMRSPRAWSTSYTCSSGRSLLVAANGHCPTTSASRSRSWTSAGSQTASFTSTTALAAVLDDNPRRKQPYLLSRMSEYLDDPTRPAPSRCYEDWRSHAIGAVTLVWYVATPFVANQQPDALRKQQRGVPAPFGLRIIRAMQPSAARCKTAECVALR